MNNNVRYGEGSVAPTIKPAFPHPSPIVKTGNMPKRPIVDCMLWLPDKLRFWCARCSTVHKHGYNGGNRPACIGEIETRAAHCYKRPEWLSSYDLRIATIIPASKYERPKHKTFLCGEKLREVVRRAAEVDPRYAEVKLPDEGLTLSALSMELARIIAYTYGEKWLSRRVVEARRLVLAAAEYLP